MAQTSAMLGTNYATVPIKKAPLQIIEKGIGDIEQVSPVPRVGRGRLREGR